MYREYNHLLTSQLDSQRYYFEDKLDQQKKELLTKPELMQLTQSVMELQDQKEQRTEVLQKLKKETADIQKKVAMNKKRVAKVDDDLELVKEVNKNLKYSIASFESAESDIVQLK